MNLVEDERVACFDAAAEVTVEQANDEANGRKQKDEPVMGFADVGSPVERDQKEGGCCACQNAGKRADGASSAEKEELARLRRENHRLRQERDILAKAAAWFARESKASPNGFTGS